MVDPAALREALATAPEMQSDYLDTSSCLSELKLVYPREFKMQEQSDQLWATRFDVLVAAARELLRLMETAETVWWCAEHRAAESAEEGICEVAGRDLALCEYARKAHTNTCRMVEAVLTRRDSEPFVNQQGLW